MSEAATSTLKKRGGWPKGKPRVAMPTHEAVIAAANRAMVRPLPKMKARPNWDDDTIVGVGNDGADRLKVPPEIVDALDRDGMALQWITRAVRGQEAPQELSKFTKGGWTPVNQSDFEGVLDGMFMSKGIDDVIVVEDCMLVARPKKINDKAKAAQLREANEPLRIKEAEIGHGIPGVTGSNHPTVRNTIKKSMERIEIPE